MTLDSTITEELAQPVAPPSGDVIVVEDLWRTYDMGIGAAGAGAARRQPAHQAQ